MLNRSFETDLGTTQELDAARQEIAMSTANVEEGVTAFLQIGPRISEAIKVQVSRPDKR